MLEGFDFSALDDPSFKEDSVREEIIAPLLRRLGYQPSGEARVQRSRALTHPFVRIGTRKHPVSIIPDYTLWYRDKPILVLDAKSPSEPILKSTHVEQAYSYAIHPEVRCRFFALCNGRDLAVYDIHEFEPILVVASRDFESQWPAVVRHLSPGHLVNPALRKFQPDFGLALRRMGIAPDAHLTFLGFRPHLIARVADDLYSASASAVLGASAHMATFDFPPSMLEPIVSCLAPDLRVSVENGLRRSPFKIAADCMLELDWVTRFGPFTESHQDLFVPLQVIDIFGSRFNGGAPESEGPEIPPHIFSLRRAVADLRQPSGPSGYEGT